MTVNSHLNKIANAGYVRDSERANIDRSIVTLQSRANSYFDKDMTDQILFGSYSRGTILPRLMDSNSDIDYMFVFRDDNSTPQTYLNRIRRFVNQYYTTSEIAQSNPTIVLKLNHIRFELVPAIQGWLGGLSIPAKASDYNDWIGTDPKGFNEKLVEANREHGSKIKPLVRVMKYWNVRAGYPFEPFMLEQEIVANGFFLLSFSNSRQLCDYFYSFVGNISAGFFAPQWKKDAVIRLRDIVAKAKSEEQQGLHYEAESTIKALLPVV